MSEVPSCFGMMSVQMEKVREEEGEEMESPSPPTSLPARIPQNSTFLEVAAAAARRKSSRSAAGICTSRSPFRARGGAPGAEAVAGGEGEEAGPGKESSRLRSRERSRARPEEEAPSREAAAAARPRRPPEGPALSPGVARAAAAAAARP